MRTLLRSRRRLRLHRLHRIAGAAGRAMWPRPRDFKLFARPFKTRLHVRLRFGRERPLRKRSGNGWFRVELLCSGKRSCTRLGPNSGVAGRQLRFGFRRHLLLSLLYRIAGVRRGAMRLWSRDFNLAARHFSTRLHLRLRFGRDRPLRKRSGNCWFRVELLCSGSRSCTRPPLSCRVAERWLRLGFRLHGVQRTRLPLNVKCGFCKNPQFSFDLALAEIVSLAEAAGQKALGVTVNVIARLLITGVKAGDGVLQHAHISAQHLVAFTLWAIQTQSPQRMERIFSLYPSRFKLLSALATMEIRR